MYHTQSSSIWALADDLLPPFRQYLRNYQRGGGKWRIISTPGGNVFVHENHLDDDTDDEFTLRRSGALRSGNSSSRDSVVANKETRRFSAASFPNSRPASQLAGLSAASSAPSTSSTSHSLERAPIPVIHRRKRTQSQRDELASAVASLEAASNRRSDAREAASIRHKSRIEEAVELLQATRNEESDVNNTLDALSILQNESQATIYITIKNRALREVGYKGKSRKDTSRM
ncbi:hypothetical protein PsorP6_011111 [Peronosclerospora sorghi]|uniref:Uncharacterized protein n=1 Tax=Peronosclerospora sorghi TaxID=230839 RepID=A0ACC0VVE9_9STRA|nr:hypothetical protein PsorP6_011111 [Peronosclerospora sorghi]